jgi:hypothetical protein
MTSTPVAMIANDNAGDVADSKEQKSSGKRRYVPPGLKELGTLKAHLARWPLGNPSGDRCDDPLLRRR